LVNIALAMGLHRLDRQWAKRGRGVLVRYADDLLVMCRTRREADDALEALTAILAELGLEPKQAKRRVRCPQIRSDLLSSGHGRGHKAHRADGVRHDHVLIAGR
jgi:hypothetical protein